MLSETPGHIVQDSNCEGTQFYGFDDEIIPRADLGQIYYAFQEGVLYWVFSDPEHGCVIPFYNLKGMEVAMSSEKCVNRFGSKSAKEKAIEKWNEIQIKLNWKTGDMDSLERLEKFKHGYTLPRLAPAEFKKALENMKALENEEEKSELETFEKFVEMYFIVEENCPDFAQLL